MGTTENTSLENFGNDANEIYIDFSDLNGGIDYRATIYKEEPNFDELLEIISKYDYEQPKDGPIVLENQSVTWEDYSTEYVLVVKVYNNKDTDTILLTDSGYLTRNKNSYTMPNSKDLFNEFIEYTSNNDVFHPDNYYIRPDDNYIDENYSDEGPTESITYGVKAVS